MKNADRPAMPIPLNGGESFVECGIADGLTKREIMAMNMMQGILSAGDANEFVVGDEVGFAGFAVSCADALLAELDRTQTP